MICVFFKLLIFFCLVLSFFTLDFSVEVETPNLHSRVTLLLAGAGATFFVLMTFLETFFSELFLEIAKDFCNFAVVFLTVFFLGDAEFLLIAFVA